MDRLTAKIRSEIARYVAESPANRFPGSEDRYFDEPLIGIAAADDPLWADFKQLIGSHHLTPAEMVASYPGETWSPGSVISWVLPIATKTREANRQQMRWPSLEWVLTANRGNDFLVQLRVHVVEFLRQHGYRAVPPRSVTKREKVGELDVAVSASWSERHVAYAAGLGTFGLNGGLITQRGIAHRCGSVIVEPLMPPTTRTYLHHKQNCLSHRQGTCGACIDRCPCGAVTRTGKDKTKCFVHIYEEAPSVLAEEYGVNASDISIGSCGLCQTDVPCEARIPLEHDLSSSLSASKTLSQQRSPS